MDPITLAALAVALASAVALWFQGSRYSRRYVERHRARPPATWLFRRTGEPDLEEPRRAALVALPILIVAAVVYVLRS